MRHALSLVVFVAVLLCMPATFAPEPPIPLRTPSRAELLELHYPGLKKAIAFWYRRNGAERAGLTTRPNARLRGAYARVLDRTARLGFRIQPPEMRQTKPELELLLGPGTQYVFGMYYGGPRIILVNGWWADRMEDWELEYLVAHEVGHAIDLQYERHGHRLFKTFSDTDNDDFVADVLSMLLTHPGSCSRFLEKHPGVRGIQEW